MCKWWQIFYLAPLLFSFGCGNSAEFKAAEAKAQALIARRATTNEVAEAYGGAQLHIYTQRDALGYHSKQPHEQWSTISKYPLTYEYPTEQQFTWVLISFDAENRAVAYYFNVQ